MASGAMCAGSTPVWCIFFILITGRKGHEFVPIRIFSLEILSLFLKGQKMELEIRLNKYLSECGVCSRRQADEWIQQGKVKVNGEVAEMGRKVTKKDKITLNGKEVKLEEKKVVLALYKPAGVECTAAKEVEQNVVSFVNYPIRVYPVGRLDKESEGLLLLTNDGYLSNEICKARNYHEKEYVVTVREEINKEFLDQMRAGVYLSELEVTTRPCKVEKIGKFTFKIILTQGLNRQIRRMCRELSFHVTKLKRIRVLNVTLENLKPGEYRELSKQEIDSILKMLKKQKEPGKRKNETGERKKV